MAPAVLVAPRDPANLLRRLTMQSVAPDPRALRALALYRERGAEIERTGPWTYLVPSMSGGEAHAVNYRRETCDCRDM